MYTDIDCEYHLHLQLNFIKHLMNQYSLHMLGEVISTEGPIHINFSQSLALMAQFNLSSPLTNPFFTVKQRKV